jgi:hypothetical protein
MHTRLSFLMVLALCWFQLSHNHKCVAKSPKVFTSVVVTYYGYNDCIRLQNSTTSVTLCPSAGGRVLQYSVNGKEALYLPPGSEGWIDSPSLKGKRGSMHAGRFDIGPEVTIAKHPKLWQGVWNGQITGTLSARLTSQKDEATGVRLIRDFELAKDSTELKCTQTIENISDHNIDTCHWSRTFAPGGGICVVPLSGPSRFPNKYVMYTPAPLINYQPEDKNIRVHEDYLEITGVPEFPKLGFDSYAGWLAYLMPNDLMFVKRYPAYRDRVYNEVAGLTLSVWYPDRPMVELEPIGPAERLAPGESASFTETWYLAPHKFPKETRTADWETIKKQVGALK